MIVDEYIFLDTKSNRWIANLGKFHEEIFLVDTRLVICSPWRIVDDCGGAFALGAIGGTFFHSIKGFRHAPSVRTSRLKSRPSPKR